MVTHAIYFYIISKNTLFASKTQPIFIHHVKCITTVTFISAEFKNVEVIEYIKTLRGHRTLESNLGGVRDIIRNKYQDGAV